MKVAIWARTKDNVIGINGDLAFRSKIDLQRYKRITQGQTCVCGLATYNSLPDKVQASDRRYLVVSGYDATEWNRVVNINNRDSFIYGKPMYNVKHVYSPDDIMVEDYYIIGGKGLYTSYLTTERLKPEIVLDCVYKYDIDYNKEAVETKIDECIDVLNKDYILWKSYVSDFENEIPCNLYIKRYTIMDSTFYHKLNLLEKKIQGDYDPTVYYKLIYENELEKNKERNK